MNKLINNKYVIVIICNLFVIYLFGFVILINLFLHNKEIDLTILIIIII